MDPESTPPLGGMVSRADATMAGPTAPLETFASPKASRPGEEASSPEVLEATGAFPQSSQSSPEEDDASPSSPDDAFAALASESASKSGRLVSRSDATMAGPSTPLETLGGPPPGLGRPAPVPPGGKPTATTSMPFPRFEGEQGIGAGLPNGGGGKASSTMSMPGSGGPRDSESIPNWVSQGLIPGAPYPPSSGKGAKGPSLPRRATASQPSPLGSDGQPLPATMLTPSKRFALPSPAGPDFVFRNPVGRGGQGIIWKAFQPSLGREVAIKQLVDPENDADDFLREAYVGAELDHPNIVPIHDMGLAPSPDGAEQPLLAMKLVKGTEWEELINQEQGDADMDRGEFLAKHLGILIDVCNAMAYAHSKGILHRDLKPHQVMVGDFGEVYLMDWGLAVSLIPDSPDRPAKARPLAEAANRVGTPAYMAPEQTEVDVRLLGFHTDIYLLGGILYKVLAGVPPHPGETAREAFFAAKVNKIEPLPPDAPEILAELAMRAMDGDPDKRHRSVKDFREVLEDYLSGADRRRQSQALVREARQIISDQEGLDYQTLSSASDALTRAAGLWPENPDTASLRQRLIGAFARAALDKRDLILARLQAERLNDDRARAALLAQIDAAQEIVRKGLDQPPLFTAPRIAGLVAACALVTACMFAMMWAANNALFEEVRAKVRALAAVTAMNLDNKDLAAIGDTEEAMAQPEFQRVLAYIRSVREQNKDIAFIYTLKPIKPQEGLWEFIVDSAPEDTDDNKNGTIEPEEEGSPPGLEYEDGPPAMANALSEPAADLELYTDQWGTFLSGYAPIRHPEHGRTMAIVGVDVKAGELASKFRLVKIAGGVSLLVLLSLMITAMIAFFGQRQALEAAAALDRQIKSQISDLRGKDISLA